MYAEDLSKNQKKSALFGYHLKSRQEVLLRIIFNLTVKEMQMLGNDDALPAFATGRRSCH